VHGKNAGSTVAFECASRQYKLSVDPQFTMANPASVIRFGQWLADTGCTVFAFTQTGRARIGAPSKPTPPTDGGTPSKKAASKEAASKAGARKSAPKPSAKTVAADAAVIAAGERMVAADAATVQPTTNEAPTPREGRYTGLLAQQSKNSPGQLVKIVSADMPSAKGHGDWLRAHPALAGTITAANVNDRVAFTLNPQDLIVNFEILGDVSKETGHRAGVKTSGKQQPAEPKRQPTDPKVKRARKEIAAAKALENRASQAPTMSEAEYAARVAEIAAELKAEAQADGADDPTVGWQPVASADGTTMQGVSNKKKRTPKKAAQPIANCSGTAQHRTTCKGNCLPR
jgi:hypothetical protein